ncbi:ribosome-associated translation inhibitor RaiA [Candidatus Saccharibacteria bacterium]|nr:ribosome-associated translation inhibitor RaiA [Candidatus Saccharibacteria bacterium]
MIHTVSAEGFDLTPKLQKYTTSKIRDIEKYIPRKARESAVLAVHYKTSKKGQDKTCTLALQLPQGTLSVHETTSHMYTSLDISVVEMRRQLAAYKDKHSKHGLRHRLVRRLRRQKQDS